MPTTRAIEEMDRTNHLAHLINREIYLKILDSGVVPEGLDMGALAAKVAAQEASYYRCPDHLLAWASLMIVGYTRWRETWTRHYVAGRYWQAIRCSFVGTANLLRSIRHARTSERHLLFEIPNLVACLANDSRVPGRDRII